MASKIVRRDGLGGESRSDQQARRRLPKGSKRPARGQRTVRPERVERAARHRCFMDGIDWQHHLEAETQGTRLFPSEKSLRREKKCLKGGCGVVEVEVRLIRWVEPQELKYCR